MTKRSSVSRTSHAPRSSASPTSTGTHRDRAPKERPPSGGRPYDGHSDTGLTARCFRFSPRDSQGRTLKSCPECGMRFAPSSNRQIWCKRCRFRAAPRPRASYGQRVCALCGRAFEARSPNARFCGPECAARAARPGRRAKYENPQHRGLRRSLEPVVARGATPCARCGELILLGESWDLDHRDDGAGYLGPSHARCNRATARHAKERRRKRS
jgi:DNA-directed RNA polymerase subunit RPC12/RpoP